MYAIISELDPASSTTVRELWQRLKDACGLAAIYDTPIPHFTWFVADDLNMSKSAPILEQIAGNFENLTIHTFGLGIFTGEHPVLYLPMVKSVDMIALHREIWDQVQPYSKESQLYYSPPLWVPHISLAVKDLTKANLGCAVNEIAFDSIELFIQVNNLVIGEYTEGGFGKIHEKFYFDQ